MSSGDTINAPFPLYMEDFDRDTFHLSVEEQMIYLRALTYIWKHGFIPADEQQFGRLTGASMLRRWRLAVASVQRMLIVDAQRNDVLTQKRVEQERAKYLEKRDNSRKRKRKERESHAPVTRDAPVTDAPPLPSPLPKSVSKETDTHGRFEEFWKAYPKRPNNPKKPARLKFEAACKRGVDPEAMIAGARGYAGHIEAESQRDDWQPSFVAQAETWLNQEAWEEWASPKNPQRYEMSDAAKARLAQLPDIPEFLDRRKADGETAVERPGPDPDDEVRGCSGAGGEPLAGVVSGPQALGRAVPGLVPEAEPGAGVRCLGDGPEYLEPRPPATRH